MKLYKLIFSHDEGEDTYLFASNDTEFNPEELRHELVCSMVVNSDGEEDFGDIDYGDWRVEPVEMVPVVKKGRKVNLRAEVKVGPEEADPGNMKIKKWLRDGNDGYLGKEVNDTNELLRRAGRALDQHYSHEIMGEILFEGEDGKMYVGCVEFIISEANPDYAKEVLEEDEE